MRRLAIPFLVVLALPLVACGSDDPPAVSTPETEVDDGAFPVSIQHAYGETTVDAAPTRIVTVGLTEQDALLALGVVPVGTTEWFGEHDGAIWEWATDELEALDGAPPAIVGDATAVNFEKVAAQSPDLILAIYSGLTEEDYDKLAAIAPTVAQPEGLTSYGVSWQDLTTTVGLAIGQAEEAEALVAEVESGVEAAAAAHPEFAGASSVMATPYEGTFVYGAEDPRGRLLTALGFELPPGLAGATGEEYGGNLSPERADLLDVDAIVWLDSEDGDGPLGGPLYETFAVHTEAREVFLDSFGDPLGGATSFVSVLSLPFLLDGLVPMLAAAVDGDPATEVPARP